ncbi:MAG: hypothetical protein U0263_27065 [Polyangiaceae bacterium]
MNHCVSAFAPRAALIAVALGLAAVACAGSQEDSDTNLGGAAGASGASGSSASGGATSSGGTASGGTGAKADSGSGGTGATPGAKNGATCKQSSDCASAHCADGVCCDSDCAGECRSCAVPGKLGTCTLASASTDPDADCKTASDTCTGTCDGAGACAFPGGEKLCGAASCTGGKQSASTCDGSGQCVAVEKDCGLFACFGSACLTTCQSDADCVSTAFCNATSQCEAKKDDGKGCSTASECASNVCVSGVCCNTTCDAPQACWTGKCLCDKTACATGDKCITWYSDVDGDGFGDASKKSLGCESTGPTGGANYAKNGDDCYDTNPNAKPGQLAFFPTDRGDGSYDYNCNNATELEYPDVTGLTCGDCGLKVGTLCTSCGAFPGVNTYGFGCNATNKCSFTGAKSGFLQSVACGKSAVLYSCNLCSSSSSAGASTPQGCR